jgi:hypothetical protein
LHLLVFKFFTLHTFEVRSVWTNVKVGTIAFVKPRVSVNLVLSIGVLASRLFFDFDQQVPSRVLNFFYFGIRLGS